MDDDGAGVGLDDIARRYEETLSAWSSAAAENIDSAERANRLFDRQRKDLVRLRVEKEGRARIEALMRIRAFA